MAGHKISLYKAIVIGVILAASFAFLCPILMIIAAAIGTDGFAGQFMNYLGMFFGYLVLLMGLYFLVVACVILLENRGFAEDQAMVQAKMEQIVERQNTTMESLLNISWLSDKTKSLLHRDHELEALN